MVTGRIKVVTMCFGFLSYKMTDESPDSHRNDIILDKMTTLITPNNNAREKLLENDLFTSNAHRSRLILNTNLHGAKQVFLMRKSTMVTLRGVNLRFGRPQMDGSNL